MESKYLLVCVVFLLFFCGTGYGSQKKGIALSPKLFLCDDFKALNNVSWWYDWQMNFWYYHHFTNCTNIESHKYNHIPMAWGYDPRHTIGVPSDTWAILGFNEPNFHSQSNLTAAQAVTHWREIEKHSHGRPLVSPAAAPCSTQSKCYGNSFDWFDEFFRLCQGCRVDYLATHAYHCHGDTTMAYLRNLYHKYGKKIWLTEFACPNSHDIHKQLKYMQELLPQLEAADFVYRYSWYKARITTSGHITTAASLLHSHTSSLTTLGKLYNSFQGNGHHTAIVG
ncbi:uncharacterized protein LOC123534984 [Mercenaria mercenaria]|uniref:uncharacterized protein LOC123534984 n=1 Tax=Mercenaria mercenaria TaxID=6596 RepID=UPI00234F36DF|nr:uncharacterized protein LOC123534984 [Mercenaria mercenaria]